MKRCFLLVLLFCWAHATAAKEFSPYWLNSFTSDKVNCVAYARQLAQIAKRQKRQTYFVVGFSIKNQPHVFIVVDGWAIDNGHLGERVFQETEIESYMIQWWIVEKLPKNAVLRIDKDGHKEVYEGN